MKKVFLLALCWISWQVLLGQHDQLIDKIEDNLIPALMLEGSKDQRYNIYERMIYYRVPGVSIAFFDDGEIIWAKGYGFRNLDSMAYVDDQTMFQAASISKPVAAVGALKLVEDGAFELDAPVNGYLKEWQIQGNGHTDKEDVTLRRLVTHSAGLTVHGFRGYASDEDIPSIVQVLNGEKPANSDKIEVDLIPGTKWRYSGGGYTVMQKMIEDFADTLFEDFMKKTVLDPLKMMRSTYAQPLPDNWQGNAATGYRSGGKPVKGRFHGYPEKAAAGLWTTPSDLARFAIEIRNSQRGSANNVLSKDMTDQLLTKHLNDWGLGPYISGTGDSLRFGHGGSNEGFRCQLVSYLNGEGVAIMTNSDNGGALVGELLRSFSEILEWPDYKPTIKKVFTMSTEQLDQFVGNFVLQTYEIKVTTDNDGLSCTYLWDGTERHWYPEGPLAFFDLVEGSSAVFNANEEGQIISVTIDGQYTLIRK